MDFDTLIGSEALVHELKEILMTKYLCNHLEKYQEALIDIVKELFTACHEANIRQRRLKLEEDIKYEEEQFEQLIRK